MKKAIVILVFIIAGFLFFRMFMQHQERQRLARQAIAAEQARAKAERERAEKEKAERERAEKERIERERAEKEKAERERRAEEENRLRLEREKAAREEAAREALRKKEEAKRQFIADNIAFFTAATPVFAGRAERKDKLGATPERATFRVLTLSSENKLKIYSLTVESGKLVEGVERHFDADPTPLTIADFKTLTKDSAWASRREGSDAAVFHSPHAGKGKTGLDGGILDVGKADLGRIAKQLVTPEKGQSLSYVLTLELKPYGKLALGKVGCRDALSAAETGERIRSAIHAQLLDEQKRRDKMMKITFTDGPAIVRHSRQIEVPRRFLRDNLKDIRAGRVGRKTDWRLVRETRRQNRKEWLELYEEADRRERGIEKPYEIVVPEGDVSRALQEGSFSFAPAN